jgi:hypothetical protein
MRTISALTLGIAIAASAGNYAGADDKPGSDWMPQDPVKQKLGAAGYSAITNLKADDGFWKGKAVHEGRIIKFRVDPKTGEIRSEKPED